MPSLPPHSCLIISLNFVPAYTSRFLCLVSTPSLPLLFKLNASLFLFRVLFLPLFTCHPLPRWSSNSSFVPVNPCASVLLFCTCLKAACTEKKNIISCYSFLFSLYLSVNCSPFPQSHPALLSLRIGIFLMDKLFSSIKFPCFCPVVMNSYIFLSCYLSPTFRLLSALTKTACKGINWERLNNIFGILRKSKIEKLQGKLFYFF